MITEQQKHTIQSIVTVFETGQLNSAKSYGNVTNMLGDSGGLTYGRMQTTINSGNLYLLIKAYCEADGQFSNQLKPFLQQLLDQDHYGLASDADFIACLKQAGLTDPVMWSTQDAFFDRIYWNPAVKIFEKHNWTKPLTMAIVFDSIIHGSWQRVYDLTVQKHNQPQFIGEIAFITAYNETRYRWLKDHINVLLHRTIYRQNAFRELIKSDNWDLTLPVNLTMTYSTGAVGKVLLNTTNIYPQKPASHPPLASAQPVKQPRLLYLTKPTMTGDDVVVLQNKLIANGIDDLIADGDFGPKTDKAMRQFQTWHKLKADGIVGATTRQYLGILS